MGWYGGLMKRRVMNIAFKVPEYGIVGGMATFHQVTIRPLYEMFQTWCLSAHPSFCYCSNEAMIKRIHISGYRSVRDLSLELRAINVLTGPNGCGKSNLYNSLYSSAGLFRGN